jgi:hypothetical protein
MAVRGKNCNERITVALEKVGMLLSVMAISIVLKQNEKNMFTGDFYKQSDD